MRLTADKLCAAIGCTLERAQRWIDALNAAMEEYEINTPQRVAAFLAQIGHESGRLRYVHELWGPTLAQAGYEGRADLGNVCTGDGIRFKGRGLIQVTGRANYKACGSALGLDLESHPEMLEQPDIAARSAGWFWSTHDCNEWADRGNFEAITRRINGGLNGQAERLALWGSVKATIQTEVT